MKNTFFNYQDSLNPSLNWRGVWRILLAQFGNQNPTVLILL